MKTDKPRVVLVSELLDRLLEEFGTAGPSRSELFQTALRLCADESKNVQRGQRPASLRELATRAHSLLETPRPAGERVRFAGKAPAPESPPAQPADALPAATAVPEPLGTAEPAVKDLEPFVVPQVTEQPPDLPEAQPRVQFEDLFPDHADAPLEVDAPRARGGSGLLIRVALGAIAVLAAAIVAVVFWPTTAPRESGPPHIVESFPAPRPTSLPTATPADLQLATAVPPEPAATAATYPTPAAVRAVAPPKEAVAAVRVGPTVQPVVAQTTEGAETMRSPDWADHEPVFVIHFASYRSRANATADAARLARDLGRPAYALVVNLQQSGTWYRVVLGDFATAEEARAFRADLVARSPRDVDGVYLLAAP